MLNYRDNYINVKILMVKNFPYQYLHNNYSDLMEKGLLY